MTNVKLYIYSRPDTLVEEKTVVVHVLSSSGIRFQFLGVALIQKTVN